MSGFWKGYANVNDDVRHTYEQVFFGKQTTGNLTESEVPGMKPEAPAVAEPNKEASPAEALYGPDPEPTREEREATAFAYAHAANAPGIRAEIESFTTGNPYGYADAPDIPNNSETNAHAHVDFYGSIWGQGQEKAAQGSDLYGPSATEGQDAAGGLYGTASVEAPTIEPPKQGNDMTPGD